MEKTYHMLIDLLTYTLIFNYDMKKSQSTIYMSKVKYDKWMSHSQHTQSNNYLLSKFQL